MKSKWTCLLYAAFFFTSCYKEDGITGDLMQPNYKVEDSDDPLDHYIYEFYQKYHAFILYEYEEKDYVWNISSVLPLHLVKQADRSALSEGVQFMEKAFFSNYEEEFRKKYFPFKILMADSVQSVQNGRLHANEPAGSGLSFLAIGNIRQGINRISQDSLIHLRGAIHAFYWANFLYDNERLELPEAFWKVSGDYYGKNLNMEPENEKLPASEIDVKKYGFWEKDPESPGPAYCMAPKETLDIYQFVYLITTHTKTEMESMIAPYNKLKDKYYLLTNYLKEVYGADIQNIGNNH